MRLLTLTAIFSLSAFIVMQVSTAQDPKPGTKEEPKTKAKGQLPMYWGQIGLSDEQKQKVYTIQNKHNEEIDKLEAQIKAIKEKMAKERGEVLTADQKKKLEDIIKSKTGG
jgi:Spy/CpxP family protein refolding chaperone